MDKKLEVINSIASACGGCHTTDCGTCTPDRQKTEGSKLITRRDLGRLALASAAVSGLSGCSAPPPPAAEKGAPAAPPAPAAAPAAPAASMSQDLNVVQKSKGPIMTVLEEFYKMGPGPSSSHTMGPMRITYDFFQRLTKLPENQLKRATALKVHLFGSLSATGKGHGTDRAALAGLLGKAPATCPPQFLDGLAANAIGYLC